MAENAAPWDFQGNLERKQRRAMQCVNALTGIADPEQFIADVRELVELAATWVEQDDSSAGRLAARLAAQLKGGV